MCTKFQVDWTSTSSKTTLTKNFNMKQTDGRRHRPENIMPLYYHSWGIKNNENCMLINESVNDISLAYNAMVNTCNFRIFGGITLFLQA